MKIIRTIVELRLRQAMSWNDVIRRLNKSGFRTKKGLTWKVGTARMIYEKWAEKI